MLVPRGIGDGGTIELTFERYKFSETYICVGCGEYMKVKHTISFIIITESTSGYYKDNERGMSM